MMNEMMTCKAMTHILWPEMTMNHMPPAVSKMLIDSGKRIGQPQKVNNKIYLKQDYDYRPQNTKSRIQKTSRDVYMR